MSRPRWNILASIVIGSIALANIVSGGVTAAGLGVSLLAGWATGLLIRYLLGTDTTRPSGNEIAKAMTALGLPLTLLRAAEVLESGRKYDASTTDGQRIDLIVLDYLNLLTTTKGNNSYERIKYIAEETRAMTYAFNCPLVTVTQTNRSGTNVNEPDLTTVSESYA
jgi:hypothetical protein